MWFCLTDTFIRIDCEAPSAHIERQLFGERVGQTEEVPPHPGGFFGGSGEATIFFDQVSALSSDVQTTLFYGIRRGRRRGFWLMASASDELSLMVRHGLFRKELYALLNLRHIRVPTLRERREDIAPLARHFLETTKLPAKNERVLSDDAQRLLAEYDWMGNVAELKLVVQRAASATSANTITDKDLPGDIRIFARKRAEMEKLQSLIADGSALPETRLEDVLSMAELEKQAILATLDRVGGDKMKAAELLGIGKTTLYRKLSEYAADQS
jgi:DNA-binding NtrC family response regulator